MYTPIMQVESVSEALRRSIRASGQTLAQIGEATGVDQGRLSRFLNGKRELTTPAVDALSRHFGLTLTKARKR